MWHYLGFFPGEIIFTDYYVHTDFYSMWSKPQGLKSLLVANHGWNPMQLVSKCQKKKNLKTSYNCLRFQCSLRVIVHLFTAHWKSKQFLQGCRDSSKVIMSPRPEMKSTFTYVDLPL